MYKTTIVFLLLIHFSLGWTQSTNQVKPTKPILSFNAKSVYLYALNGDNELEVTTKKLGKAKSISVYGVDEDNYLIIKYNDEYYTLSKNYVNLVNGFESVQVTVQGCLDTSNSAASNRMGICSK